VSRPRVCNDDGLECAADPLTMRCRVCDALVIGPMSGPQAAFLASPADVAIYGGGAGGGKTWMLALDAASDVHVEGYAAIMFRRTSPELVGGGSIWEATQAIYRHLGGRPRSSPNLDWTFPSRAMVELRHLQHEADVYAHQGKQYAFVGFDELTHFEEAQFWYLVSRMRTTCGIRPRLRATCNPDPDSFVRKLVDWWIDAEGYAIPERSGRIRWFCRRDDDSLDWSDTEAEVRERNPGRPALSFTFVPARLADNPVLLAKDPGYIERLDSLPKVDRDRLKGGNWNIRPAAGLYFPRRCFEIIDRVPGPVTMTVRAWDKAATRPHPGNPDPDWTRGAKVSRLRDGRFVVEHVEGLRGSPGEVEQAILAIAAQDGPSVPVVVWQDPGQAGVVDRDATLRALSGFQVRSIRASRDKLAYAGVWAPHVEAGRVLLVRGAWTDAFLAEAESFPEGKHDDAVDAVSLAFQALTESRYAEALAKAKSWL